STPPTPLAARCASRPSPPTPPWRSRPTAYGAAASCTRSATGTRPCSRTRWPPSITSPAAASCSASAAAGTPAKNTPMGSRSPPVRVRLRMLDEAIQCIRSLLTEDVADFDGEFFQLRDARCEPKPVQERLPLWVGGAGEKLTLRTAARHADGWNVPFLDPDTY